MQMMAFRDEIARAEINEIAAEQGQRNAERAWRHSVKVRWGKAGGHAQRADEVLAQPAPVLTLAQSLPRGIGAVRKLMGQQGRRDHGAHRRGYVVGQPDRRPVQDGMAVVFARRETLLAVGHPERCIRSATRRANTPPAKLARNAAHATMMN